MFVNYILISSGAAQRRLLKKDFYQQKVDYFSSFSSKLRLGLVRAKTVQEIHQLLPIFWVEHYLTFADFYVQAFHIHPVSLSHDDNRRAAQFPCRTPDAPPHVNKLANRQIDLVKPHHFRASALTTDSF